MSECYKQIEIEHLLFIEDWDLYTREDAIKLVEHFLNCHSMKTRERRQQVLTTFAEQLALAKGKMFNGEDSDFTDVIQLFKACHNYRDIELLAYAVYQLEDETAEWKKLDTLLCKLHKIDATYTCLQQLQNILEALQPTEDLLVWAYINSTPPGYEVYDVFQAYGDNQSKLLSDLLAQLVQAPHGDDGKIPFIKFVQYFIRYAKSQQMTSKDLENWLKSRVKELCIPHDCLEKSVIESSSYTYASAKYLLITVEARTESTFGLQAWLMDDQNELLEKITPYPPKLVTLRDISKCIDKVLSRKDYVGRISPETIVEIFLPIKFLSSWDVDQWNINKGGKTEEIIVKLGIEHTVVVRLIDRTLNLRHWFQCKNKWTQYLDFINGRTPNGRNYYTEIKGPVLVANMSECEFTQLHDILLSSHVVCLVLDFAPPAPSQQETDIAKAILGAGIPIALWPRKLANPDQYNDEFLSSKDFSRSPHELPELLSMVGKQRSDARKNTDHHGHHLTFLWDDPDRLPPGIRLRLYEMST